ncbi:hypothetical protein LZ30DRAFT_272835 [Colletotrichum cereale]|nr:hypothetical protein LZ30DRAFT_272835 [Colletotrichum cereale]
MPIEYVPRVHPESGRLWEAAAMPCAILRTPREGGRPRTRFDVGAECRFGWLRLPTIVGKLDCVRVTACLSPAERSGGGCWVRSCWCHRPPRPDIVPPQTPLGGEGSEVDFRCTINNEEAYYVCHEFKEDISFSKEDCAEPVTADAITACMGLVGWLV